MRQRLLSTRHTAPVAIVAFVLISMAVVASAQVLLNYQHLTSATRGAASYAARSDRPTTAAVKSFAVTGARPLPLFAVDVVNPTRGTAVENANGVTGDEVKVSTTAYVQGGPYGLVANFVNGLGSFFGRSQVLTPTFRIHSEAVRLYK